MIAIVGVTGAVGREILAILAQGGTPAAELRPLASKRSAGAEIPYPGGALTVEELDESSFEGIETALFSAGADIARRFAPVAVATGVTVIDNSSAFRMDAHVPLVVPEVNGDLVAHSNVGSPADAGDLAARPNAGSPANDSSVAARPDAADRTGGRIIANPNCSAIILVTALDPLRRAFGIERLVVSTYQAASGAGAAAMRELSTQAAAVLAGDEPSPEVFAEPCAFNVFSHDTPVDEATGRNVEEQKVIEETRKIFDLPDLRMSTTCIRVPVLRAHAESINLTLASPATEAQVREALRGAPGVTVIDDRAANDFPTSLKASGGDNVLVGRIRGDASQDREGDAWYGFELFITGDQLRKGAALNALQIAGIVGAC